MTLRCRQLHGTPLTYRCRDGVASLRDERDLFAEAWANGAGARHS
ncbi:MAG TPA: hypothetical protein VHN98_00400 [Acidimicrobiales bacterium]|nr:hypothetical protein [Acidimicrobiales bacterium]